MLRILIRNVTATTILAGALLTAPQLASAQPKLNCAQRAKVVEYLGARHSETLSAVGFINRSAVFELYSSKNGSWTVLVTGVSGLSCVVFAGESWEAIPQRPGTRT